MAILAKADYAELERRILVGITKEWINMMYGGDPKQNLYKWLYGGFHSR